MLFEKLQLPALSFSNDITNGFGSCSKLLSSFIPHSAESQPKIVSNEGELHRDVFKREKKRLRGNNSEKWESKKKPIRRFSSMKKWERVRKLRSLQIEFPCQTFLLVCRSFYFLLEFIDAVMFLSFVSTQRLEIDKDINFPFFTELFLLRSYERAMGISWQSNCAASQSTNCAEESNLVRSF